MIFEERKEQKSRLPLSFKTDFRERGRSPGLALTHLHADEDDVEQIHLKLFRLCWIYSTVGTRSIMGMLFDNDNDKAYRWMTL